MHDDARRPLTSAHLVDGLGYFVETDDPADARRRVQAAVDHRVEGAVPVLRVRPPPNCIVMPLCVASVQSIVPASYQPPAAYTRARNSHESTMLCSRPFLPTHSKMTCVV